MNNGFIRYKANTQKLIAIPYTSNSGRKKIYNSKPYTGNVLLKNKILIDIIIFNNLSK